MTRWRRWPSNERSPMSFSVQAIEGGITAPGGFRAAGIACGIKANGAPDLALIAPEGLASAAGVFTTNRAQAAPVAVSREHLETSGGRAAVVVVNSGCANACTGEEGAAVARATAAEAARLFGCAPAEVLVASTGVIGVSLDLKKIVRGLGVAASALGRDRHLDAARAIMTTDLGPKEHAVRVESAEGVFHVGGMAKGAGMIEPMLATMLAFVTTDAAVEPPALKRAIADACRDTFNAITVDGDSSTNDCLIALASGASRVAIDGSQYAALVGGLRAVCRELALAIVRGGEGATKLVAVTVTGAASDADARRAAKVIANSPLVKTAIHGGDPNWGRLIAAAGRAGVPFELSRAVVRIGQTVLFQDGRPFDERAPDAARYLRGRDLEVAVDLGAGGLHQATVWTCDLSAEYVKINAEYRT